MNSEKGKNDKKLAAILNEIDDISVERNLSNQEITKIKRKITIYLPTCSSGVREETQKDYSEYIPKNFKLNIN